MDRWFFSHSPSLYAILSGALIGVGINLLTGLLFAQEGVINEPYVILAIAFFLLSSGLFAYISLVLEGLRDEATDLKDLLTRVYDRRKILRPSVIIGFASVIAATVLLSCAMNP